MGIVAENPLVLALVCAAVIRDFRLRIENRCRECPETAQPLQRFRISWGQFGNHCREYPEIAPALQRFRISGGQSGNRCKGYRRHTRMARLQHNRCGDKEWPACYGRSGDGLPHPILIYVAANKNGVACYGRSGNWGRVRF